MITRNSFFIITSTLFFLSFIVFSQKNTVNIKIEGMKCEAGCAMYIENELEKMKGVVEASIDFKQSEGEVILKKRTSDTDILSFINKLKGGVYKASIIDDATNQINLQQEKKIL